MTWYIAIITVVVGAHTGHRTKQFVCSAQLGVLDNDTGMRSRTHRAVSKVDLFLVHMLDLNPKLKRLLTSIGVAFHHRKGKGNTEFDARFHCRRLQVSLVQNTRPISIDLCT
jgi:hypothetical protein